eukprot:scaffold820_cov104-Isochrysis_galbana.AAC.10
MGAAGVQWCADVVQCPTPFPKAQAPTCSSALRIRPRYPSRRQPPATAGARGGWVGRHSGDTHHYPEQIPGSSLASPVVPARLLAVHGRPHLEVHRAERVLGAEDVGEDDRLAPTPSLVEQETHGHARHHGRQGDARAQHGQAPGADRGHRRRAARLGDEALCPDDVREGLLARHRSTQRPLGQVAVAHLAPPRAANAAHLTHREGREGVLQVEALRLLALQVLVPLGHRVVAERGEYRAVHRRRERTHLDGDGAHLVGGPPIGPLPCLLHNLPHGDARQLLERSTHLRLLEARRRPQHLRLPLPLGGCWSRVLVFLVRPAAACVPASQGLRRHLALLGGPGLAPAQQHLDHPRLKVDAVALALLLGPPDHRLAEAVHLRGGREEARRVDGEPCPGGPPLADGGGQDADGGQPQLQRLNHGRLGYEGGGALDHHHRVLGARHNKVKGGDGLLRSRRVDDQLAVHLGHPHARHRLGERHLGQGERGRRGADPEHVRDGPTVVRKHVCGKLGLERPSGGDKRPDGPVDQPRHQRLVVRRPAVALDVTPRGAPGGRRALGIVHAQRRKVDRPRRVATIERGCAEDVGLARGNADRT